MKCREVRYYLIDYLEGNLIDEMREEISLHINKCNSCRKKYRESKAALRSSGTLKTKIHEGGEFWESVSDHNEIDPGFNLPAILYMPLKRRDDPEYRLKSRKRLLHSRWIAVAAPVSAVLLAVLIAIFYFYKTSASFWPVVTLQGSPTIGDEKINETGIIPVGEWLKTDSHSKARVKIGMIGQVDVGPGSELQLISTKDKDYKIFLKEGKISAKTRASANFFSVLTPSALFKDISCTYTIEVDNKGSAFLQVTEGNILVRSGDENEIVPAGAVCEAPRNYHLGTPYFLNASTEFKAALARFDYGQKTYIDIETLAANARDKDALSLWYLLRRAEPGELKIIFDRLSEICPPPEGVSFEGILSGNNDMLFKWWGKLGYSKESLWHSIKG